jgi:ribosomal protein S18 acetylase RimI-like enzyme
MDYVIRPLNAGDEPLLWEMLYQGIYNAGSPGSAPSPEVVHQPEFARYATGWGRSGDTGFVAHDPDQGKPLGAAWLRLPEGENRSPGSVVPELAFAVRSEHRRQGIGAALLTYLVKAEPQYSAVSIPVSLDNPAVRLYERFGFKVVQHDPKAVLMRRDV